MNKKRVVLLDSSGALHRCFHGYRNPRHGQVEGKVMDVAAVYGYLKYVRKLATELDFETLVHVIDPPGGSAHRLSIYPEYKGKRDTTNPVLTAQLALLPMVLDAFGQIVVRRQGVEADDLIASLARRYLEQDCEVLIISSDKDLMQLVEPNVILARYVESNGPGSPKTHEFYTEQDVIDKFGVEPRLIPDWLALVGDSVDNIPGVHTVGDKTATKWLQEYGSLAALMTAADSVKGKLGERLREALPNLPLYRNLTQTIDNIPVEAIHHRVPDAKLDNGPDWARSVLAISPGDAEDFRDDLIGDLIAPDLSTPAEIQQQQPEPKVSSEPDSPPPESRPRSPLF